MKKKRIIRSEFFTQFEAKPQMEADGIKRVLVISEGPAKGHFCVEVGGKLRPYNPSDETHDKLEKIPVFITAQTLQQVADSGNSRSEVKAKLDQRGDHAGSAADTFGGYSNFQIEGGNVYADLKFLEGTPHRSFVEGIASRFADEFGNSIDFQSSYTLGKDASGQKIAIANCLRLGSIDLVDSPAATNSLFEEQESPSPSDSMPLSPEDLATIGDMITKAVAAAAKTDETQDAATIEERLAKLESAAAPEKKEDEPEKKGEVKTDDEKLAAIAEKAALKLIGGEFAKLSKGFVQVGEQQKTPTEDAEEYITAQLSAGCPNRATAIARMGRDKKEMYAKFRAA